MTRLFKSEQEWDDVMRDVWAMTGRMAVSSLRYSTPLPDYNPFPRFKLWRLR